MKSKVLALLIPALLAAGAAHAAEVYNKDGNKLDLYGKVDGLHYFLIIQRKMATSYARLGFKGETQINDQLTGYGQWEYNIQANNTESSKPVMDPSGICRAEICRLRFFRLRT